MAREGGKKKGCLFKFFMSALISIVCLVIVVVVLINIPIGKFGVGDIEVYNGMTISELGLADATVIDIIKEMNNISKTPPRDTIVKNGFDSSVEETKSNSNFADSSLATDENGKPKFDDILSGKVVYGTAKEVTYEDTTLAYITNEILGSAIEDTDSTKIKIEEITINDAGDKISAIAKMDISSMKADIEKELNNSGVPFVGSIKIPSEIYVTISYNTSLAEQEVAMTFDKLIVNGQEGILGKVLTKMLNEPSSDGDSMGQELNDLGDDIASVINNLGKIVSIGSGKIVCETHTEI